MEKPSFWTTFYKGFCNPLWAEALNIRMSDETVCSESLCSLMVENLRNTVASFCLYLPIPHHLKLEVVICATDSLKGSKGEYSGGGGGGRFGGPPHTVFLVRFAFLASIFVLRFFS